MARLTICEAAVLLHTAPSTIRSWEQRFGYPNPVPSTSDQRLYDEAEIALLADALRRGVGIASAIRQIREETGSHGAPMCHALGELDLATSDTLLEAGIALRGVSYAFDETVLAAIERLAMQDVDPSVLALTVNWAIERACRSRHNAGTPALHTTVIGRLAGGQRNPRGKLHPTAAAHPPISPDARARRLRDQRSSQCRPPARRRLARIRWRAAAIRAPWPGDRVVASCGLPDRRRAAARALGGVAATAPAGGRAAARSSGRRGARGDLTAPPPAVEAP